MDVENVTWIGVFVSVSLLSINGVLSLILGLRLGGRIVIASIRCIIQLSLLGYVLKPVFDSGNGFAVFFISVLLIALAATEITFNKAKRRFRYMWVSTFISMLVSTFLSTTVGTVAIIPGTPWYLSRKFIPICGMILGNSISGITLGINSALESLCDHRDRVNSLLAFGASRWEAARPVAVNAISTGMLPVLNSMSVIGLISIPGMMTGQVLAGQAPLEAAKYQMIIMFLIASAVALGVTFAVIITVTVVFDNLHRLRIDWIDDSTPIIAHWSAVAGNFILKIVTPLLYYLTLVFSILWEAIRSLLPKTRGAPYVFLADDEYH